MNLRSGRAPGVEALLGDELQRLQRHVETDPALGQPDPQVPVGGVAQIGVEPGPCASTIKVTNRRC
jgi:hypothetical protein